VLPDLVSNTVEVVKLTSIASVVALAGAALLGRHGALGDLQFVANRAGRRDLSCYGCGRSCA